MLRQVIPIISDRGTDGFTRRKTTPAFMLRRIHLSEENACHKIPGKILRNEPFGQNFVLLFNAF
jgi:hypothetical protein